MNEPIVSIPAPQLSSAAAASRVRTRLAELGYAEKALGDRLGRNVLGLPRFFDHRWRERSSAATPLDPLIGLLIMGEETRLSDLEGLLDGDHIADLEEMRVIEVSSGSAKSNLVLFPCLGLLIATDNDLPNPVLNRVMCLFPDSYVMAAIIDRPPLRRALDLCTGSGIYALFAASHADQVLGVDINERAVAFSRFNAGINGIRNAEFKVGDLYEPAASSVVDMIVSNPPFNPDPDTPAGDRAPSARSADFWSGGRSGEELLAKVVEGIDQHLSPSGICHVVTLLVHPKLGPSYRERLSSWLGGRISDFDVLIWATPRNHVDQFKDDPAKAAFLREQFERFEFGTISIRRRAGREPIYYHGLPPQAPNPLFDDEGRIRIKIDNQAFTACAALAR